MTVKQITLGALLAMASAAPATADVSADSVLHTYVSIGEAAYGDALSTAQALLKAVDALIAQPSDSTLADARTAWKAARVPYQQSEAFRFGSPIVDAWEGKMNAWPLDEGLMDYVAVNTMQSGENDLATLNIIANPHVTIAGQAVDATEITPALVESLHEADGVEANVASGYHAIEFLLWGQDLNGTGPGAGARPASDFIQGAGCTGGHCDRRAAYLHAATELLVSDLAYMADNWKPGGAARAAILADPKAGLTAILTGMGSLSYGEVAGERMKLGLLLNDPEEEHDCFSDNTHWSLYYNGLGIQNVYLGHYIRTDGSVVSGPSLSDLVAEVDPARDDEMRVRLGETVAAMQAIVDAAEGGMAYDQMLAMGNDVGEALITAGVEGLIAQTKTIERVVATLGLDGVQVEGSDSLASPSAVFQ